MAILDKQGLQHYANKMCNANNRKVGSKSLPTALNDIDTAIDGFKTLFETEYGTPVNMELENNENIFSVGTGTNVDKSSEVENSFTDVELNGNSLVSILSSIYTTSAEISTSYKHIGDFIPNIKPKINQTYTILPLGRSDLTFSFASLYTENVGEYGIGSLRKFGTPFSFVLTKETTDIIKFRFYLHGNSVVIPNNTTVKFMILEGDWTNKPIPQYFEGMKSVGEKEDGHHKISILSRGKNLFDTNLLYGAEILSKDLSSFIFQGWASRSISNSDVKKLFKPNTTYTIKAKAKIIKKVGTVPVYSYDVGGMFYHAEMTPNYFGPFKSKTMYNLGDEAILETTFTTPNCLDKYELRLYSNRYADENVAQYDIVEFSEIQLEESTTSSEFESYKSDKKEISLNEPLRGLPNEVRDTIEKINGEWKIVRKVGSIVLNGSEHWKEQVDGSTEEFLDIRCGYSTLLNRNRQNGLCDKFNYITKGSPIGEQEGIQLYAHPTQSQFIASMSKSRFSTVDSFKEYLAQNHTTVLYELVTPIIEDISPITLQCWKNGTISIDEVLPVKTTHTAALNKSAQIQKNIEELTTLRNRVKALEEQYDKTALNQAYEVELLRLDMQLDNII